jgi:hypothetical protein
MFGIERGGGGKGEGESADIYGERQGSIVWSMLSIKILAKHAHAIPPSSKKSHSPSERTKKRKRKEKKG